MFYNRKWEICQNNNVSIPISKYIRFLNVLNQFTAEIRNMIEEVGFRPISKHIGILNVLEHFAAEN